MVGRRGRSNHLEQTNWPLNGMALPQWGSLPQTELDKITKVSEDYDLRKECEVL